ncbi:branched-chain amino acid transport system ATP-binding protein [Mesorhizobium albiziae]|uniref:Branched-chain amino acid transport system ATP-binding protein n=1 Tax=Neomesorhizobium albiziae TaxID=335020 RepID=A0A1I3Y7B8_9HYPH|nr:ABC transporter ATP-binding protein [Mesorhizobium albiziae]GLS30039.1 ABC transporter ATP-binding protein [Mesorhizobium albiziae]SFK27738.1 branched-chain amino acid transport system ATP-binding protein [Mesorhizobium albiziae]
MTPLLTTKGLSRSFGGLHAVRDVDFQLLPGEIRAIIGPNGAGKTTFVSLVCGRIEPSTGAIVFDGDDITNLPAHQRVRRGIAYTFQITSVFANLTAYENVALSVQRALIDKHQDRAPQKRAAALHRGVMEALERTGIASHRAALAGNLSYGHQRLLEVAMGLALKPRLLILDEPTQGLSDGEIESFIGLARDISGEATVLLIEHNMQVVMALADRITVFNAGRILAEGAPEEIRSNVAVQNAYLGTAADA